MKIKLPLLCVGLLFLANPAYASVGGSDNATRLETAVSDARNDVSTAIDTLAEIRREISQERTPLMSELAKLRSELEKNRREAQRLESLKKRQETDYFLLREEIEKLREVLTIVRAAMFEYRRTVTTRGTMPEIQFLEADTKKFDEIFVETDPAAYMPALKILIETAEKWNTARLGGYVFRGACLNPKGTELSGSFAVFGPAAYFLSDDGSMSVPAIVMPGSLLPAGYENISDNSARRIESLVRGEAAAVPVDVTSGDAIKMRESGKTLMEHIGDGGIVMIPILLTGIAAVVLIALKIAWLMKTRTDNAAAADKIAKLLEAGRVPEAEEYALALGSPQSKIFCEGIKHRNASPEEQEEIMNETLFACLPEMERHLATLAVFGAVAPLLGLLGTVTGMIQTFRLVTIFGTGDARQLSGGISEALVTTVAGLLVAIPVLLAHAFLSRGVKNMTSSLETAIIRFINRGTLNE